MKLKMAAPVSILVLIAVIVISGCVQQQPIGGETDEHGCLPAAGYSWCEAKRKCLRTWEEDCPADVITAEECEAMGGRILNIVGGDECHQNETAIAGISSFISPNLCCVPLVSDFDACADAGYPVMESYPRQCRTPDGRTFTEAIENCTAPGGESMTLAEAKEIALASACMENGTLKDTSVCNSNTGTWWIDMDAELEGCSPACVVSIATMEAEINWRCTGLVQ